MTTRGVRNNNPGNIDRNAAKWQGMAKDQSSDARFIVFTSAQYGIRALARTLLTYENERGCNTVRKIINRWAPPVENNTGAYVEHVADLCGVRPDDVIDVDQVAVMLPLVKAIIAHENAGYKYPEATVLEGLHMAGIADAKPKPLVQQRPFVAQAAGGLALVGSAAAQYSAPLKSGADQLAAFTGAPVVAHMQTVLLTLAGICCAAGLLASYLKHKAG